jgi:hypothetical protein
MDPETGADGIGMQRARRKGEQYVLKFRHQRSGAIWPSIPP